jgi:DNA-binding transcriptional regulator YiaG
MGKVGSIINSEIIRLTKGEVRKVSIPLKRDVRLLKNMISPLRKSVLTLERFAAHQQKELSKREIRLEAPSEEIKQSRFSPRLLQSLRKRLGITQKELAILAGVTVGAAHLWESGKFRPKENKMGVLVALRKLNRRQVRELLNQKIAGKKCPKVPDKEPLW